MQDQNATIKQDARCTAAGRTLENHAEIALRIYSEFECRTRSFSSYISRKTTNSDYVVEHLLDEARFGAIKGAPTYNGGDEPRALTAWLWTVVRNTVKRHNSNKLAKARKLETSFDGFTAEDGDDGIALDACGFMAAPELTPAEAYELKNIAETVAVEFAKAAHAAMSKAELHVIRAADGVAYMRGLCFDAQVELAERAGISHAMLRKHINTTAQKLQAIMTPLMDAGEIETEAEAAVALAAFDDLCLA